MSGCLGSSVAKGRTPGELFRRATQSKARRVEQRLSVNVNANQSFLSCIYNFCLKKMNKKRKNKDTDRL